MKKTIQTIVLAMLCLNFSSYGQDKNATPLSLKIGDPLPSELLNLRLEMVNQKGKKTETSFEDAKDKLIILDFWTFYCGPCLASLKKLDKLQAEFAGQMVVIPSTNDEANIAAGTLLKNGISLPSSFGKNNAVLKNYFPHRSVPHQVWIMNGRVKAITAHYKTNDSTIRAAIAGEEIKIKAKIDITGYSYSTPLTEYAKQKGVKVNTRILVSPYIEELGSNSGNSTEDSIHNVFYYNHPIISMYSESLDMDFNRIIPAMKNPQQYTDLSNAPEKLMFNFQLLIPQDSKQNMTNKVLKALDWSFQLKGQRIKRTVDCYVIKNANNRSEASPITGEKQVLLMPIFSKLLNMNRIWSADQLIFLDESQFSGEITFTQPLDMLKKNVPELKKVLAAAGLVLEKEQRELEMFELTNAE